MLDRIKKTFHLINMIYGPMLGISGQIRKSFAGTKRMVPHKKSLRQIDRISGPTKSISETIAAM